MMLLRYASRVRGEMSDRVPRTSRAMCELLSDEIGECLDLFSRAALRRSVMLGSHTAEVSAPRGAKVMRLDSLCYELVEFSYVVQSAVSCARASHDREITGLLVDLMEVIQRLEDKLKVILEKVATAIQPDMEAVVLAAGV
ncbi:MAG: hypothetical protein ACAI35_10655 [Candidatus Methylacidiphilales bacterium]|nr:hypothetical protein [Candidatus Methylacidiphilales bacterium]